MVVMVYTQMVLGPRMHPPVAPQQSQVAPQQPGLPGGQQPGAMPPAPSGPVQSQLPAPGQAASNPQAAANASIQTATNAQASTLPSVEAIHASQRTAVTGPLFSLEVVHLGGRLGSFTLHDYHQSVTGDKDLNLVSYAEGTPLPLGVYVGSSSDAQVQYTLVGVSDGAQPDASGAFQLNTQPGAPRLILHFQGTLPNGSAIHKRFTLDPNSYLFNVEVKVDPPLGDSSPVWLEWAEFGQGTAEDERLNPRHLTFLRLNEKIENVVLKNVTSAQSFPITDAQWTAVGGKYFMAAILPPEQNQNTQVYVQQNLAVFRERGAATGGDFRVYLGPKEYRRLSDLNLKLERTIDLGTFTFLAYPLLQLIRIFHDLLGNYGLAIILLTLVIKTAFLPLTSSSLKSMKAMQDLQPEIKALRERITDPGQLNQEMMGLYKKRGVNPLGGCFPMLIQLPVFFGLYSALLNSIDLRHSGFALWINDLSSPERLNVFGVGVPVMILLMGASMFIQQYTQPSNMDETQRKVMMFMPVMFTVMFIVFPFPSGLVLYWLVNNMISIVQQMYLRGERRATPLQATLMASVAIFVTGYLLTLI